MLFKEVYISPSGYQRVPEPWAPLLGMSIKFRKWGNNHVIG